MTMMHWFCSLCCFRIIAKKAKKSLCDGRRRRVGILLVSTTRSSNVATCTVGGIGSAVLYYVIHVKYSLVARIDV